MSLTLADIDGVYEQIKNLPKEDRLVYCEALVDKTQAILAKNPGLLTSKQKASLTEIITLAQSEIKKLRLK